MNTVAWVLILIGVLVARAVQKGRVFDIPADLGDAFLATVQGDSKALKAVFARTGEANAPGVVGSAVGDVAGNVAGQVADGLANANISAAALRLGSRAKGYRWEGTGPDYYDCSGLMWRACQAIGYQGSRFTTSTMRSRTSAFKVISPPGMQGPGVTAAQVNDFVLWPAGSGGITGHVGVITGNDRFYSARSVRSGIGEASISGFRRTKPIYVRYVGRKTGIYSDPFARG